MSSVSELIYCHSSGLVLIEKKVVSTLNQWRQTGMQSEAGGILIGSRRPPHIHVTACTTPFRRDKRSRFEFYRKDPRHVIAARQLWKNSNQKAYYLGDWHTHPVGKPRPSAVDHRAWGKLIKSKLGPELLFIIVGRTKWYVQMKKLPLHIYMPEVSPDLISAI